MAKYGNILTLIDASQSDKNDIEIILVEEKADYLIFNELFFIETNSKLNTKNVLDKIQQLNIKYLFYHNHNSDGSRIRSKNIDSDIEKQIKNILKH